jgi:hypothetical protein
MHFIFVDKEYDQTNTFKDFDYDRMSDIAMTPDSKN